VINGICYVLRTGTAWRHMPHDPPHWNLVLSMVPPLARRRLLAVLARSAARAGAYVTRPKSSAQCRHSGPSVGEDDRRRGPARGFDDAQKIQGRKRHLLVDKQGFVRNAVVRAAEVADREGAWEILHEVPARSRRLELVWMDPGDRGEGLRPWLAAQALPPEIVTQPRRWARCPEAIEPPPLPAFTVRPHRWLVVRTLAWLGRCRRLSQDDEQLPAVRGAMLDAALLNSRPRRSTRWRQNQPSGRRARCRS
jgi:putative transposase